MAKLTKTQVFSKARIYFDGDIAHIEEIDKEEVREFNLTEILKSWEGIDGLSITIKQDSSIEPEAGD